MSLTKITPPSLSSGKKRLLVEAEAAGTDHYDTLHYDIAPELGSGFQNMKHFGSGLGIVTSDCILHQTREDKLLSRSSALSVSLLLSGYLSARKEGESKSTLVSAGDVVTHRGQIDPLIVETPGKVRIRSLMIELPLHVAEVVNANCIENTISVRRNAVDLHGRYLARSLIEIDKSNPFSRIKAEVLALDLVQHLLGENHALTRSESGHSQRRTISLLDQACDILRAERADPPTIVKLARRIGMNEFALKSEFRKRFGCTIAGYVRSLRMHEAKTFLELGDCSVQQAALRVGYTNPSHFAAAFRKEHGFNPSQVTLAPAAQRQN